MATSQVLIQLRTSILLISLAVVVAAVEGAPTSSVPPLAPSLLQEHTFPTTSFFAPILADLGFHELAGAASSLSSSTTWRGPTTIFAPTDSSLHTCSSCSVPLLLQEHTAPGFYSLHYLTNLAFGTKIETLAPGRCLTVTSANGNSSSSSSSKIFIGGAEITHPNLYNDGVIVVHGLQGFISHLSPISCNIERLTSLSFPPPPPMAEFLMMHQMIKDAMVRLRISGYSILALALRLKYADLVDLRNVTVFALDDDGIFSGGHEYISDLKYHIVPDRLLMSSDLESLPEATALPTMENGKKLKVTTAGGGGPLAPMRINYVKIKSPDMVHNRKIVIHGLSMPFPHFHGTVRQQIKRSRCKAEKWDGAIEESVAAVPGIESNAEMYCNHNDHDRTR